MFPPVVDPAAGDVATRNERTVLPSPRRSETDGDIPARNEHAFLPSPRRRGVGGEVAVRSRRSKNMPTRGLFDYESDAEQQQNYARR